jgi:hypothetical protein
MVTPNEELLDPLQILSYVILYLTQIIHGAEASLRTLVAISCTVAVGITNSVLWVVMPCGLLDTYQVFAAIFCLCLFGIRTTDEGEPKKLQNVVMF